MDKPDELDADIEKLKERKEHLEEVKKSYLKAEDVLPHVQDILDNTDWLIDAFENRPPEASEIVKPSRKAELDAENRFLKRVFTVLDVPSPIQVGSSASITVSGSTDTYEYVNRVRDLGLPSTLEYGDAYISRYHNLLAVQDRPKQVRVLLEELNATNLLERFDRASSAYSAFRADAEKRTMAANEMRNLLHGLKGELWNRAKQHPKENMTWSTMSARLAINGGGGQEHISLSNQKRKHNSLIARLSDVLKDREGGSVTDLNSIWTETLDHLYTVLGLLA